MRLRRTQLLFIALALFAGLAAALTMAGVPNGLRPGSPTWWSIVGLLAADAIFFATVTIAWLFDGAGSLTNR